MTGATIGLFTFKLDKKRRLLMSALRPATVNNIRSINSRFQSNRKAAAIPRQHLGRRIMRHALTNEQRSPVIGSISFRLLDLRLTLAYGQQVAEQQQHAQGDQQDWPAQIA